MLPAREDLTFYRGDTQRLVRRLKDANGDFFDLTGCTPKAQIRTLTSSPDVLIEFTCSLDTQSGSTLGGVILAIPAGATSALPSTTMWDFQLTHPDGSVRTYLFGNITAEGQVTL